VRRWINGVIGALIVIVGLFLHQPASQENNPVLPLENHTATTQPIPPQPVISPIKNDTPPNSGENAVVGVTRQRRSTAKSGPLVGAGQNLSSRIRFAYREGGNTNPANVQYCGNGIRCGDYFIIESNVSADINLAMRFVALDEKGAIADDVTIKWAIGRLGNVTLNDTVVVNYENVTLPNGTLEKHYQERNVSIKKEMILYNGTRMAPGTNYVHVYADNLRPGTVRDWIGNFTLAGETVRFKELGWDTWTYADNISIRLGATSGPQSYYGYYSGDTYEQWQSFNVTTTGSDIVGIRFYADTSYNSPTFTMNILLVSDNDTNVRPNRSAILASKMNVAVVADGSTQDVNFTTPYTPTKNLKYWIGVTPNSTQAGDHLRYIYNTGGTDYAAGENYRFVPTNNVHGYTDDFSPLDDRMIIWLFNKSGAPAANPCVLNATINNYVECSNYCNLTATQLNKNNITFNGSGIVRFTGSITNWTTARIQNGCVVRTNDSNGLHW
jgi:hypothetical protein